TLRALSGSCATHLNDQAADLDLAGFDVIAVSVGTNDCGVKPTTSAEFTGAIGALVERAGSTPVLMVNNPGADRRAADLDAAQLKLYAREAAALVRAGGGAVLDARLVIAPLGQLGRSPDGMHVGKLGHALFIPALRVALWRCARNA
ncbi:MAG: GDSL-type esterase/lipase family protein, partial [Marmoricola sp.]